MRLEMTIDGAPCLERNRHIGSCIYCGATENLTDEHVIPLALGGRLLLLHGSCVNCNKVTSRFERDVLRTELLLPRTTEGMPTRRPSERPAEFQFEVVKHGHREVIRIPADECPTLFAMLLFRRPRHIEEYEYESGISVFGSTLHCSEGAKLHERLGVSSITVTGTFEGTSFGRMLAKIAYGIVVFHYGVDALKECYVLPCILGRRTDVGYWVGNSDQDVRNHPREELVHRVELGTKNGEVHALLRLFAHLQTPEYHVVVGKLK